MAKRKPNRLPRRKVAGPDGKPVKPAVVRELKTHERIAKIHAELEVMKSLFKDLDEYRDSQRDFLTDLMFSINAFSEALAVNAKMLRFLGEKGLSDDSPITYGQLKAMFVTVPVLSSVELLSTKAKVMSEYMEQRKRFRPLTYDDITLECHEWARKLEMKYEDLEAYLSEDGVGLKDVIEMLGLENLVEDLTPDEEMVVKQNVAKTIRKIREEKVPELDKPLTEYSEEELEAYLLKGGKDEPDGAEQPEAP